MPTHVILICLVMNTAISAVLTLGALLIMREDLGGALVCFFVAAVCGYTAYVIDKMRRYLKSLGD